MISLDTDQACLTEPDWFVVAGGDYAPDALVECWRMADPAQRCAFYALFIAAGEYPG